MSELRAVAEYRSLRRSELWPDRGAPDGSGRSVLLIGGFGVPARTVAPLAHWLGGSGWTVRTADLGWNTACGTRAVDTVLGTLTELSAERGPVAIVGHSRGGLLGRVASVRAPDLVTSLTTVCTPWAIGPPDRPGVAAVRGMLRTAHRLGVDALGSIDCAEAPCCDDFREQMSAVPACAWTAIRSTRDRIAGDQALVDGPDATIVLTTSHLGGVLSIDGWRAIGRALDAAPVPG